MRGGMVVFVRAYDSRTRDTLLRGVAFAKVQLARLGKTRAKAERGRMAETFSVVWFCLIDESKKHAVEFQYDHEGGGGVYRTALVG